MKILFNEKIIEIIAQVAHINGHKAYVVGGYVRDWFLGRKSKDIDILIVEMVSIWLNKCQKYLKIHHYRYLKIFILLN